MNSCLYFTVIINAEHSTEAFKYVTQIIVKGYIDIVIDTSIHIDINTYIHIYLYFTYILILNLKQ